MKTEVLVAICGVVAAVIGLVAVLLGRRKVIRHEMFSGEKAADSVSEKATIEPPAVRLILDPTRTDDSGEPVADGKCHVTLLYPGHGAFADHDELRHDQLDVAVYGDTLGQGSGRTGFKLGFAINPGKHSVTITWSALRTWDSGSRRTYRSQSTVHFVLRKPGRCMVRISFVDTNPGAFEGATGFFRVESIAPRSVGFVPGFTNLWGLLG